VTNSNFHRLEGAKPVGSPGDHTDFVVEALNSARGDLAFGSKPVQDQGLVGAEHAGHFFHRFETAPHGFRNGPQRPPPRLTRARRLRRRFSEAADASRSTGRRRCPRSLAAKRADPIADRCAVYNPH